MKRKTTIALAAFIVTLTLAAAPHRASAATDIYLQLDGIKGESAVSTPPLPLWLFVLTATFGL